MALGLKYFAQYRDIEGVPKEIRFLTEGYAGEPIEWFCTNGAVDFEYAGFDEMFEQPIIASQARISLFLEEKYDLSDFVKNRRTYFCQIIEKHGFPIVESIKWSGWVEPWNAQRPYKKPPWVVNITASCGLAQLSKKKYVNNTSTFKKTGLAIIQECLALVGAGQGLRLSTHMVETSFSGAALLGLTSFEINTSRYFDENGEAMYCDVIVNDILNHFNAEVMQWENIWVIRAVVDNGTGFADDFTNIGDLPGTDPWPRGYLINNHIATGERQTATMDGGVVRILPPKNKYRTEIDFGTQVPFFENGNMFLWTDAGLVGWTFNMDKGNPGWERYEVGGETSRGILKINGKSPNPIRKKKKKKFLQVLLPILVGAIGAAVKKTYYDVEPLQYIESTGGTISKGDKSVTVSFDYETEAFSSDILISIRIPIVQKATGKTKNFWVDPSTHPALAGADKTTAGATEEFHLIRIPAVDMGALTSKGTIDVSGNPNYPAANFTPGSKNVNWTWTVTGVPAGQFRKIGGVNGVIVENDDLIIARVANLGGSQEAVGGNWEVISQRNNTKKGTFSLSIALNTVIIIKAGDPWPADKIYVRFYKMADDKDLPGDWYKVYNLNGALEGFVAKEESGKYATTLERGDVTDEEAEKIQLITGDYNPWYAGAWTKPNSIENTRSWKRRPDLNESMGIYRAMMLDRLCLTTRPLLVVEGSINLRPTDRKLTYLHTLIVYDLISIRMRFTRYSYNDYSREVKFTAVEIKYEEIPAEELKQEAYIPGSRQLNTVPGQGDGIYPSKQDSTSGRLNAEDLPLTEDELNESLENGSRLSALFEKFPPLVFIAGEYGTDSVDLNEYLSEVVLYNNANQEEDEIFDFNTLEWLTVDKPDWVSYQKVVFLEVTVSGKPVYIGSYSITFKVKEETVKLTLEEEAALAEELEESGEEVIPEIPFFIEVEIPIIVYPKTILTYELLDTSGATPVVVGTLPGILPLPEKWDIRVKIKGPHKWWQLTLNGGGKTGNAVSQQVNQSVWETELATYRMFEEANGIVTPAGQFRLNTLTSMSDHIVCDQNIVFTLYDDEFLEGGQFFLRKGGLNIGEISLDGTSIFENPEGCDVVFVTSGTEHDKIVLDLSDGSGLIKNKIYSLPDPTTAEEGEYELYEADSIIDNGKYTISSSVVLNDTELISRFSDFEIVKKKPESEGGLLTLMQKVPGTLNFKPLAVLPKSGSEHELPVSGFNVKATGESPVFDWEGWTYQVIRGGALVTIDLSKYTGQPQYVTYPNPVTESSLLIFGSKNSIDIDDIHEEDTTHRVILTRRSGGPTGEVSAILQADFSFGTFEDPDEVPDEDETNNILDYVGRNAISEEIEDYIKYFDARVDDLSLEIWSPDNPLLNHIRVKAKGIKYAHIQDMPTMSVLGNLTSATGVPYAVPVKALMSEAIEGDLITAIAIKNYITLQLESSITGTPGYFPIYDTVHKFKDSIMSQTGTTVTLAGRLALTQATGTSPFIITSSTLNVNLNADLLDNFHGPYYLDRTNHTGTQLASTISNFSAAVLATPLTGLATVSGSTLLATDTILAAFGKLQVSDTRYFPSVISVSDWNAPTGFKIMQGTGSAANPPNANPAVPWAQGIQFSMNNDSNSIDQLVFDYAGLLYQRNKRSGTWGTWDVIATRPWVALNYVPVTRQVIAGTGLLGGGPLSSNVTLSVDPVFVDIKYVLKDAIISDWNTAHIDGKAKFMQSVTNSPTGITYFGFTVPNSAGTHAGSLALRNGRIFFMTVEAGTVGSWFEIATQTWVNAKSIIAGAGMTGGGTFASDRTITLGTPTTLNSTSTNTVAGSTHSHVITTGNIVQGSNVVLSGTLTNRLVDAGNVTISVTNAPWTIISGKPTDLSGYGILDAFTKTYVIANFSDINHVHQNHTPGTGLTGSVYNTGTAQTWSITYGTGAGTSAQGNDSRILNGQTAFTWGDHAGLYFPSVVSVTDWNAPVGFKIMQGTGSASNPPNANPAIPWAQGIQFSMNNDSNSIDQLVFDYAGLLYQRNKRSGTWGTWEVIATRTWVNAKSISAGNGLTGGGDFSSNRTISLGTPSTLNSSSTNTSAGSTHTHSITTGSFIEGANVTITGTGKPIDSNITIAVTNAPWTIVSGKPNSLAGYGILDSLTSSYITANFSDINHTHQNLTPGTGLSGSVYNTGTAQTWSINFGTGSGTVAQGNDSRINNGQTAFGWGNHAGLYSLLGHTHTSSQITDFTSAVRGSISASGSLSYNPGTGLFSFTGVTGSGTASYVPQWTGLNSLGNSSIRQTGTEININDSLGVEGLSAFRDDLHVHQNLRIGKAAYQGTLILHDQASANIAGCAAIEIRSSSKGLLLPRMTAAQRAAVASPETGLVVFQTDAGTLGAGIYFYLISSWLKVAI